MIHSIASVEGLSDRVMNYGTAFIIEIFFIYIKAFVE